VPLDKKSKIAKVKLTPEKAGYNEKEQKPEVTVLDEDGNVVPAVLYSVSFSGTPKDVGTYTVTVTAKGDTCEGSAKGTFVITEGTLSQLSESQKKKSKLTVMTGYKTIAAGATEGAAKAKTFVLSKTVTRLEEKSLSGLKNVKTITIKTKEKMSISKYTFKGISKSKLAKVKVKVNKKMSKKNFKKLKKSLQKAGIKSKNIKRVKV
jgi:hypothetical protein